jgi:predicted nucleic acid-binding protein
MMVLDASATVELLLGTELGGVVAERVSQAGETLHAPHLLDIEVTQVLRRFVLKGNLAEERASLALHDLLDMDLTRYPHDVLLGRVWQFHEHVSAYDAVYLALAEALGARLVTTDARLSRARGHDATIDFVSR